MISTVIPHYIPHTPLHPRCSVAEEESDVEEAVAGGDRDADWDENDDGDGGDQRSTSDGDD